MIEEEIYPSRSARFRWYVVAKQLSTKLPLGCLGCFSFSCGRKQFGKRRFWKTMAPLKSHDFPDRVFNNNKFNSFVFEFLQRGVEGKHSIRFHGETSVFDFSPALCHGS